MKRLHLSVKFVIYFLPLVVMAVIYFWQTNPLGLTKTYIYDFSKSNRVISDLTPKDRVGPIKKIDSRFYQELDSGLIYFILDRVHKNQTIILMIDFEAPAEVFYLGLGPERQRLKEADFEFRPLIKDGQKQTTFTFQAGKYFIDDGTLRFAF